MNRKCPLYLWNNHRQLAARPFQTPQYDRLFPSNNWATFVICYLFYYILRSPSSTYEIVIVQVCKQIQQYAKWGHLERILDIIGQLRCTVKSYNFYSRRPDEVFRRFIGSLLCMRRLRWIILCAMPVLPAAVLSVSRRSLCVYGLIISLLTRTVIACVSSQPWVI